VLLLPTDLSGQGVAHRCQWWSVLFAACRRFLLPRDDVMDAPRSLSCPFSKAEAEDELRRLLCSERCGAVWCGGSLVRGLVGSAVVVGPHPARIRGGLTRNLRVRGWFGFGGSPVAATNGTETRFLTVHAA
jgi:hypothetical protein